jgi:hypothetical protein
MDFICVADLGTWTLMRVPAAPTNETSVAAVSTTYMGPMNVVNPPSCPFLFADPIGRFLTSLFRRFGSTDPTIASIANYFHETGLFGTGAGSIRIWELSEVSDDLSTIII